MAGTGFIRLAGQEEGGCGKTGFPHLQLEVHSGHALVTVQLDAAPPPLLSSERVALDHAANKQLNTYLLDKLRVEIKQFYEAIWLILSVLKIQ